MMTYFLVGLGGAVGSVARYWVSNVALVHFGRSLPFGTLLVNVTGSFLIGLLAGWLGPENHGATARNVRALFMAGVCGGYTTFSSFSLENLGLVRDGHWVMAGANTVLSFGCCLAAVWLGYAMGSWGKVRSGK